MPADDPEPATNVAPAWEATVARVTDHVRRNLDGHLDLRTLAEVAQVSPFHFHRLFTAVAGETPVAFVRRARLDRAAKLMAANPHRRLTDIALDVGLSGASELSRSYRRAHGSSPSSLEPGRRRFGDGPEAVPPPADREADTRIVELAARRLAAVRARGVIGLDDLSADYDRLAAWAGEAGLGPDWGLVAMSWDDHETTPLDRVHLEFGAVVPDGVVIEAPLAERRLPEGPAVSVRCSGPLVEVADAWDHLYRSWFPRTGRRPANLPAQMVFRARPDQVGWDSWELDCVIALEAHR